MILLPEHGSLEETPFPRLLLDLHGAVFGGGLRLCRGRAEKKFLLRDGVPVFAESNLASESLGVQLMDAGVISRDDYARVVAHVQRRHSKEGKALLELGLIAPKALFLALKEQVRRRAVECFGWSRGEFSLDPGEAPPPDAQPFRVDLFALLQEGIETHWSSERTLADLALRMERYPTPSECFARVRQRLRSDDAAEAFLAFLDGSHTLWQAIQQASTPRALATAWVLDAAGALSYRDAPNDGKAIDDDRELEILTEGAEEAPSEAQRVSARAPTRARETRADDQTEALRRSIEEKFARLAELDFYRVLGVDSGADAEALKRAYLAAAKTYHPDALARTRLDAATLRHASQVFAKIGKAFSTLSDPGLRREYDASLGGGDTAIDANRIATAENLYRKGEILLRHGNFNGALEFLKPCVALWPEEAAYRSALGWVLYKKTPSEPEEAREHLEAAIRLDPGDGVALFRLGLVLRALGEADASTRALARAQLLERESG